MSVRTSVLSAFAGTKPPAVLIGTELYAVTTTDVAMRLRAGEQVEHWPSVGVCTPTRVAADASQYGGQLTNKLAVPAVLISTP